MFFSEQNSVENFIIHPLTGVNLNSQDWSEASKSSYGAAWTYQPPELLGR